MQRQKQLPTLEEMFADYRTNRYGEEIMSDWGSALIYRPVGIFFAWLFLPSGITASAVTAVGASLLPLMIVTAMFCQPITGLVIVLLLAIAYLILDCADGSLARAAGQVSVSGHYWDLMVDLAYRGCIYATVGYLADQIQPWPLPVDQMSCMALAAWLAALTRLARKNLNRLAPEKSGKDHDRKVTIHFTAYSFLSGLDTLFPFLAAAAFGVDAPWFLVVWITLYSLGDALAAVFEARKKFKSYRGQNPESW